MGLLTADGLPLTWGASATVRQKVKHAGVEQFLEAYAKTVDRVGDVLKWGDEVEYTVIRRESEPSHDGSAPTVFRLSLRAPEIIAQLAEEEHQMIPGASVETLWRPEYANWMVEGTPGVPYRCFIGDLLLVEMNMRLRRKEIEKLLVPGDPDSLVGREIAVSIPAYPRIGCLGSTHPPDQTHLLGQYSRGVYLPDSVINPHPRFGALTRNIRERRGSKVEIRVPLFQDDNTPDVIPVLPVPLAQMPPLDDASDGLCAKETERAFDCPTDLEHANTPDIYMDAMAFGMGLSCLQVTLQARDIDEARYLYDQLAVLAPIFLSLTAATPAFRGFLADTDVRWDVISAAVDDRTDEEREQIPKSRYSSIDCFISKRAENDTSKFNDIPVIVNKEAYSRLVEAGIDERLATHVAHLFIRDPLVIYERMVDIDNSVSTDHFENIQSTNWNTVRFKVPPPQSDIGWRTEFRPMEVQITDFENAAFAIFIVLVSRVIVAFDLNFYMPMSQVDDNMKKAHERNSATEGDFFFRKNIFHRVEGRTGQTFVCSQGHVHDSKFSWTFDSFDFDADPDATERMSMNDIINGKHLESDDKSAQGFAFPGLIPLVRGYLDGLPDLEKGIRDKMDKYLALISGRADGSLWTGARWMRHFVETHPDYNKDSRVTEKICQEMIEAIHSAGQGRSVIKEMMGDIIPPKSECSPQVPEEDCITIIRRQAEDSKTLPGQSLSDSMVDKAFQQMASTKTADNTWAK